MNKEAESFHPQTHTDKIIALVAAAAVSPEYCRDTCGGAACRVHARSPSPLARGGGHVVTCIEDGEDTSSEVASLGPRGELSIATTDTTHVPVIDDILVTPSSDGEEVGTEHLLRISYPPPSSVLRSLAAGPGHLPLPREGGRLPPGPRAAAAALLQPGYTGITGGIQGVHRGFRGYKGVVHRWG